MPLGGSHRPAGRLQALCGRAGRRAAGRAGWAGGAARGGTSGAGAEPDAGWELRWGRGDWLGAEQALGRSAAPPLDCELSVRVAAVACARGEGYPAAASSGPAL